MNKQQASRLLAEGDLAQIARADQALADARRNLYRLARQPSAETLDHLAANLDDVAAGIIVGRNFGGILLELGGAMAAHGGSDIVRLATVALDFLKQYAQARGWVYDVAANVYRDEQGRQVWPATNGSN